MARVKFQTKSPRRILSGNVGRLCVALWKSEYESQDEGGREEGRQDYDAQPCVEGLET